jgi:hypothetical protein
LPILSFHHTKRLHVKFPYFIFLAQEGINTHWAKLTSTVELYISLIRGIKDQKKKAKVLVYPGLSAQIRQVQWTNLIGSGDL